MSLSVSSSDSAIFSFIREFHNIYVQTQYYERLASYNGNQAKSRPSSLYIDLRQGCLCYGFSLEQCILKIPSSLNY